MVAATPRLAAAGEGGVLVPLSVQRVRASPDVDLLTLQDRARNLRRTLKRFKADPEE